MKITGNNNNDNCNKYYWSFVQSFKNAVKFDIWFGFWNFAF